MNAIFRHLTFLAGLLLIIQCSCASYQRYPMPKKRLQKINPEGVSFYLIDAAHPLTRGWYVAEATVTGDGISGYVSKMAEVETLEVSMLRNRTDAQASRNDILLFAKPQYASTLPDTATLLIRNDQLEKVEVCEMNHVKTFGLPLLGCTGVLLMTFIITGGQ